MTSCASDDASSFLRSHIATPVDASLAWRQRHVRFVVVLFAEMLLRLQLGGALGLVAGAAGGYRNGVALLALAAGQL